MEKNGIDAKSMVIIHNKDYWPQADNMQVNFWFAA